MTTTNRQDTAEAAARDHTNRIGASRAPAILGIDNYCTPYQAWEEIKGIDRDDDGRSEAAHWGIHMEEVVVTRGYEHFVGKQTQRVNKTLRHPAFPYVTASLDRRVLPAADKKILQVKTRDRFVRDRWGAAGTDEVPEKEACQVMVEIAVANQVFPQGVESSDVAVLFGGNTFQNFTIYRSQDCDEIVEYLAAWWEKHIERGVAPDPTTTGDCERMWKTGNGKHRDMTQDDKALLERFLAAEFLGKKADADKDAARIELMKVIGEDEALVANGKRVVTWRASSTFDAVAFAEEHPAIAGECVKLDATKIRKHHPKLHAEHKTTNSRGGITINRKAAASLLGQEN